MVRQLLVLINVICLLILLLFEEHLNEINRFLLTGTYLSHLDAPQRVEVLKDKLHLSELTVAEPIKLNTSTRYTTICKAYERPLDEMEGFRVYSSKEPKQWQEYEYASLEAFAVGKVDEKKIKVHVDDRDRLIEALEEL